MSNYDALVAQFALVTKQFVDLKTKFVSLSKEKGPKGDKGDKGDTGKTGSKGDTGETGSAPEHKWRGTKLQFQHPDGSWGDLVDLKGKDGKGGTSFVGVSNQSASVSSTETVDGTRTFTRLNGVLIRTDMEDGSYKLFTYVGDKTLRIDHVKSIETIRKDFIYNGDIVESIVISII
jgi:hypothetical protein